MPRLSVIEVMPETPLKFWLLGFLAGDGAFDLSKSYRVTAHMGDSELVGYMCRAFTKCYKGSNPIPRIKALEDMPAPKPGQLAKTEDYHSVRVNQKTVVMDLLSYARFGVYTWRVPQRVIDGEDDIKVAWLRGLFDAEGHSINDVKNHSRLAEVTSVNLEGLDQASDLLDDLGIRHNRYSRGPRDDPRVPNSKGDHVIRISYHKDLMRYMDLIGYASDRKAQVVRDGLASMTKFPMRRSEIRDLDSEIIARREAGDTFQAIGKALGILDVTAQAVCYRHGIVPKVPGPGRVNRKRGERAKMYPGIMRLRSLGFTSAQIAPEVGLKSAKEVNDVVKYWKKKLDKEDLK